MTWLVTGATGLLGANAVVSLKSLGHEVVGVARSSPAAPGTPILPVDLSDPAQRAGLVSRSGGSTILHTAAVSSIEECARNPDAAQELNVRAAADLAAQAASAGAAFVHISTDAVFDGLRGGYREEDPVSPTSVYGRTKADAERAVLDANPDALVARVNFYGWSPSGRRSLIEFFLRNLASGTAVKGFTDVVVSTMYVSHLIDALCSAVSAGAKGILHVVAAEPISKFEFGRCVATEFGWDPHLVQPGSAAEVLEHPRGADLSLDISLYERTVGTIPGQAAGIACAHADHDGGLPARVAAFGKDQ